MRGVEIRKTSLLTLLILLAPFCLAESLIFYESFDDLSSIQNNGGVLTGSPTFLEGVMGNAVNFTGSRRVGYSMIDNFDRTNGTIQFWVWSPNKNHLGYWDIGKLQYAHSWGILKNSDHMIMEVKGSSAYSYDQAWSPGPVYYDGEWHFISCPFERRGTTTYFKVCVDGKCKSSYDGIQGSSYPNPSGTFYVGWNNWYGYSDSFFDEFKIYDYAKSNDEIWQDYMQYTDIMPKDCIRTKPDSKGPVKINCSGLFMNGRPFTAKGVGYQPIPIGKTAESLTHKQQMYDDIGIRNRDFPLLRNMNANTVRTWGEVMSKSWLDDLYNGGVSPIYVLAGFWINCGENYGSASIRQDYINKFTNYVNTYKDHPAILAWGLGNENNLAYCSNADYVDDFYSLSNELARVAYEIEGENYHPVGIINGDLFNIGVELMNSDDPSLDYTDFWGSNVYPGESFGKWFEGYKILSGKPLMITEYGIDSLNNTDKEEYEAVQAEWVLRQWQDIDVADVTIGSTLMAYSDEWWKAGSYFTHDYGGYHTDRHPDGYSNEEWWGVMRTVDNGANSDIMQPREVYYELKKAWGGKDEISISLKTGWNLISIPLILENNLVGDVFSSISYSAILSYDSGWKIPTEINNTLGYWIKADDDYILTIEGSAENTPINLNNNWNLVGHPYIVDKNVIDLYGNNMVYSYNGSWSSYISNRTYNSLTTLKPGYGYWVNKIE